MEFRNATLPNGLEVVAECNPQAKSVALGYFVKTGARDESDEVAGVSHFLEHMVFKGTSRRSADDVNREFDEMGAHYNAMTGEEKTIYYASVLPEYLAGALDLLTDIMRPALRDEDFNTEKNVILEEIQMYEDQPPFGADEKCKEMHFGRHPLSRSVLGTKTSIGDLSVEQMREYFSRRYSPDNMALVVAGNVDFDKFVEQARQSTMDWQSHPSPRGMQPCSPGLEFLCLEKPAAAQQYAIQMANAPSVMDPLRYAAKILATIVGDDSGSRLFWELVDTGRAEHASLAHYDYQDVGIYISYLTCTPEEMSRNLQTMFDIYRLVERDGVTQEEVERSKNKIASRIVLGSERPRGRLFNLGANWVQRHEYRSVRDDLETLDALTADDVKKVLSQFPLSQLTTITVGPLAKVERPR